MPPHTTTTTRSATESSGWPPTVSDNDLNAVLTPDAALAHAVTVAAEKAAELRRYTDTRTHTRAGFTKNHGQGTPKAKRQQARRSRRLNRGK